MFAAMLVPVARATTLSTVFTFTDGNCSASQAASAGGCGTITLTQDGNKVDVAVLLASGEGFIDTGDHTTFTFNVDWPSNPAIDVTNLSAGFSFPSTDGNPPFGTFSFGLTCLDVSGGCDTGGSVPLYNTPLNFTVGLHDGSTLLVSDFNGNASGEYFAADILNQNISGNPTGAIGAHKPSLIPEPASLVLLGSGAIAGVLARRRRKK